MIRRYSELIKLKTFEERFNYLRLDGVVANETFGFDRYLNQMFYKSKEWLNIRDKVIIRDMGCDLGIKDMDIYGRIVVHHMNPLSLDDINNHTELLLDPEYLICTSLDTHNAIHYGDNNFLKEKTFIERSPNDTTLWNRNKGGY